MSQFDLLFALRRPKSISWQRDEGYSSHINDVLFSAHIRLEEATQHEDPRLELEADLVALVNETMSKRQRMWLFYLIARCAGARDLNKLANRYIPVNYLSRAEALGLEIQNFGAVIDCLELKGTYLRRVSEYREAAQAYGQALRHLREHAHDFASFDPAFEVALAGKTSQIEIMIGEFAEAREHAYSAARLLPLTEHDPQASGNLAWSFALLEREGAETRAASQRIEEAIGHYRKLPNSNTKCRVLSLGAEIAMDAAEREAAETAAAMTSGADVVATGDIVGDAALATALRTRAAASDKARSAYLQIAAGYLSEALAVGRQADDAAGIELINLAQARLDRLNAVASPAERATRIKRVLARARANHDKSLLSMAQSALGAELVAAGQRELGRRWLKDAIATAESLQTPGLAFLAARNLRSMKP